MEDSVEVSSSEPEEAALGQLPWAAGLHSPGVLALPLVPYNLEVIFSSIQIWVFALSFSALCFTLWRPHLSVALCGAPPKAEAQLYWPESSQLVTESGALGGTSDPVPTLPPPSFPKLTWLIELDILPKTALRPGSQTLGLLEGPAGFSC